MMGQHSNDKVERSPRALWWAVTLSAIWVVLLSVAVAWSKSCAPDAAFRQVGSRFLSCLSANEIGDFLAGASAPLAFIWLVVTVLVQAQELRAQRKELALTRREFELNRKVAEETRKEISAQAKAAQENAEFVGTQTKLLGEQYDRQLRLMADETFTALLEQLEIFLATRFHRQARSRRPGERVPDLDFHAGETAGDRNERLSRRSGDIIRRVNLMREAGLESHKINAHTIGLLSTLNGLLDTLCNKVGGTSIQNEVLAETIRLEELRRTVKEVLEKMEHVD